MKIYVVMVEDRHTDTEAEVFTTAEAAIAYAEEYVTEQLDRWPWVDDDPEEPEGWLWYRAYSPEGDCVWVVEKELRTDG